MIQHELTQGSPEWLAYRANHDNASDAPAMMGVSPYKTRTELLHERHTGLTAEVDAGTQRRFDDGHRFEALARPLAEQIIGEELYPVVGSEGRLSASFDGLTMLEDIQWEHKSLNDELRAVMVDGCTGDALPLQYQIQMEQQHMVSGARQTLFTASKWKLQNDEWELVEARHCWYTPNPELADKIRAGWAQFHADLAAYKPAEAAPVVTGKAPDALPALRIEVSGAVTASNLAEFKGTALAAIRSVNRDLQTDQDFADAEKAVKWCGDVEDRLAAAKQHALSQTTSIDELFRTMDDISAEAKRVRLDLDKLVKARKEQIREEIVTEGRGALATHIAGLNTRLGKPYMPAIPADFAGAIKGKRTVESLRDAVNTTLAHAKIQANEIADRIQVNLNTLRDQAKDHGFLFSDSAALVLKDSEHVAVLVKQRIADHQQAEAARLEAERERIRAEEAARLEREQAEAQARAQREAQQAEASKNTEAQQPQQVLKAEPAPVLADATDRGTAANESPRGGAMGAGQATAVAPAGDRLAELGRQATQMAEQVDMVKAARAAEPATLKLGAIGERLGFTLTEAFVSEVLGVQSSGKEKRAVLYRESDFPRICDALVRHINKAKAGELLAA